MADLIGLEVPRNLERLADPGVIDKAARQSLNRAVRDGRATASDRIYKRWNIKKRDINRAVRALKVTRTNDGFQAGISAKGRPLSLAYFGAKQYRPYSTVTRNKTTRRKRRSSRRGVFVQILRGGEVTHKPHAFIASVKTKRADVNHIGVFERVGEKRHPIIERKLITVASMFNQEHVMNPTIERIEKSWNREFPRLVEVLFKG